MEGEKEPRKYLVQIRTADGTTTCYIAKSEFVIGRDMNADVCIEHPELSRNHARVQISDGKIRIADLGSVNGTFLAGKRLQPKGQYFSVSPDTEICFSNVVWVRLAPVPQAQKKHTQVSSILERARQRQDDEFKTTQREIENLSIRKHDLTQEVRELSERAEVLNRSCSKAVAVRKEAEEIAHEAQKEALSSAERKQLLDQEFESLTRKIKASKTEFAEIMEKLGPRKEELASLESEIVEKSENFEKESEERLNVLEAKIREGTEYFERESARRTTFLEEKIREETEKFEKDSERRTTLLETKIREETEKFDTESRRRTALLEAIQAEAHAKEMQLKVEIGKVEVQQMESNRLLQDLFNRIRDKETQLAAKKAEIETAITSDRNLRQELERLGRKLSDKEQEIKQADLKRETALSRLKEQEEILSTKTARANEAKLELEREISEVRRLAHAGIEEETAARRKTLEQQFVDQGKQMEHELADARLRELGKIQEMQKDAEKTERSRRRFILDEIVRAAQERSEANPVFDLLGFRKAVQTALDGKGAGTQNAEASQRTRDFWRKVGVYVSVPSAIVLVLLLFGVPEAIKGKMDRTIASEKKVDSVFYDEIKERGKKYAPPQDRDYKNTYTDNVLYLESYSEMKLDDQEKSRWTLALNDFIVGRLGLSDRAIPDFVSSETFLIRELTKISVDILPQFKDQGVARMAETENQELSNLKKLLQTDENYVKFRTFEKSFYEDYMKRKNAPAAGT